MAFTHWKYVFLLIMNYNFKIILDVEIILQIPKILLHLTFMWMNQSFDSMF